MNTDELVILAVSTLITASIGFIFWVLQHVISNRSSKKQETEKETKKQDVEQRRSLLGPGGVAPKDVNDAVRMAQQEGWGVKPPYTKSGNILRLMLSLFVLGTVSYLFIAGQPASNVDETKTPSPTVFPTTDTPSTSATPPPPCIVVWEFNSADNSREEWQENLRVKDLKVKDGALYGEFVEFDPSILSPQQLNIATSVYTVLIIRYRIRSDDINGQVMWNPENSKNFTGERHMLYGIVTDGEWHVVNIHLDADVDWTSIPIVNTLRLDPVHNATSGTFEYDYIGICKEAKKE